MFSSVFRSESFSLLLERQFAFNSKYFQLCCQVLQSNILDRPRSMSHSLRLSGRRRRKLCISTYRLRRRTFNLVRRSLYERSFRTIQFVALSCNRSSLCTFPFSKSQTWKQSVWTGSTKPTYECRYVFKKLLDDAFRFRRKTSSNFLYSFAAVFVSILFWGDT